MKLGDNGPEVAKLQTHLISLGYHLPKYGADGWFGLETYLACMAFADDEGLWWDTESMETIPDSILDAILRTPVSPPYPDFVQDLTDDHPLYSGYKTPRPIKQINSIVLHQTACYLGNRPKRWYRLAAHIGIPADGSVFLCNPFKIIMWHANYFNRRSIGIEIDGNFQGVEGNDRTRWKPGGDKATLTQAQIDAGKRAIQWIVDTVEDAGGKITQILAHRQTSKNRRGCPGSAIYKALGLWAIRFFELTSDPSYTKGSGLPIPREWDPDSDHDY